MKRSHEAGNVLFFILIAVVLFGALSFVVADMLRGGNNVEQIGAQRAGVLADEILDYARVMRQTIQDLRISNGCSDEEISFENPISSVDYTNANSPTDRSCHVFDPAGGGMLFWQQKPFQNSNKVHVSFRDIRFINAWWNEGVGSSSRANLQLLLSFNNINICNALNDKLGVPATYELGGSHIHSVFQGDYVDPPPVSQHWGNTVSIPSGTSAACVTYDDRNPPDGMQIFYSVLIPR